MFCPNISLCSLFPDWKVMSYWTLPIHSVCYFYTEATHLLLICLVMPAVVVIRSSIENRCCESVSQDLPVHCIYIFFLRKKLKHIFCITLRFVCLLLFQPKAVMEVSYNSEVKRHYAVKSTLLNHRGATHFYFFTVDV